VLSCSGCAGITSTSNRAVLEIRRNYVWVNGHAIDKDTKTHRMRRIALDPTAGDLLRQATDAAQA